MHFTNTLVLLIDDDAPLRKYLRTLLSGAGYSIEDIGTGREGLQRAGQIMPAVIVLDLGLPDIDGQDVLLQLRERLQSPIIVLSGRDDPIDKISALDHGADDYLTKPFNSGELLARIRLALRHQTFAKQVDQSTTVQFGDLRIDLFDRRVFVADQEVHLTPIEFKLLATLVRHAGKVLTHQYLLNDVWGPMPTQAAQNVRVFVAGLRRKIEADPARPRYLVTEQGIGYRLLPANN